MLVSAVHAEIEDVVLRDPDVLEELPRRVLEAGRACAALLGRDAFNRLVEADMRLFPVEEARELIAEGGGSIRAYADLSTSDGIRFGPTA